MEDEETRTTGFTEAARWGRLELVDDMLREGLPVNTQDRYGRTALTLAAAGGQPEVMQFLIRHGADVNFQERDGGRTPLIALLASMQPAKTYISGTQILVDAGATLIPADKDGLTATDWAHLRIQQGRLTANFLQELSPDPGNPEIPDASPTASPEQP